MKVLRVKNYEQFQHYKDRNPPWIKFYATTLDDYDLLSLPEQQQRHLMLIWLLASKHENAIPYDRQYIRQAIKARGRIDFEGFIRDGWLVLDESEQDASKPLAGRKHGASKPLALARADARSREVEKEKEREVVEATTTTRCRLEEWPELAAHYVEEPRLRVAVESGLGTLKPQSRERLARTLAMWLQGGGTSPYVPTPAEVAGAMVEYQGDGAPPHVWSFIDRVHKRFQAGGGERQYVGSEVHW